MTLPLARRVAITAQQLSGTPPTSSAEAVMDIAEHLRCIQVDPISAVAPTQQLVLAARLAGFRRSHLDDVLWTTKKLFHYWAHAASLVLTNDHPIHRRRMRAFRSGDGSWSVRSRQWINDNAALRRHILQRIRIEGPLRSRDFEDRSRRSWQSSGWTKDQNVGRMLDLLWLRGELMISGRDGLQRIWDLSERWLPDWTPRKSLTERRAVERAILLALRALGAGTQRHIREHFTRGHYPGLTEAIARLERRGEVVALDMQDGERTRRDRWFMRADDLYLADRVDDGWTPRTVLLSPFDNLICDRGRTRTLFDFDYTIEIYVPKAKRRYGYYVLPILHGDSLIGRLDAAADRKTGTFHVHSLHAEPALKPGTETGVGVASAIADLARFTGSTAISLPASVPRGWKAPLRSLR